MNLATRPFYNERAVHLVVAALGLAFVAILALEVVRFVALSRAHGELTLAAQTAEGEAAAVSTRTARLEREMPRDARASVVAAAEEVNRLIEQRLFSWTAFFNVIEQTLPAGVMLTAVRPDADEEGTSVDLAVIGLTVADIEEFIRRLEETGVFADVLARQGELNEEGMYRAQLRGRLVRLDETTAGRDELAEGA
ncbi:MAG: PilN domain-containing protein [Acidobacteriota bacterium]|nr:PilN domain-containing protein [Acidobacteriota bacterium]